MTEHIKIILAPNKETKMQGNFKSGKRLNIRKIISFIASNYRNDKIWLKRTLPFERNYYVMLAIDDSYSMKSNELGFFALDSMVVVSSALSKAGIGKMCIAGVREDLIIYHGFDEQFTREKGAFALSNFDFSFRSKKSYDNVLF